MNINNENLGGLRRRLSDYIRRRDNLQAEVEKQFSQEKYRELNIINHHIEVCEQRISGVWERGSVESDIQVSSNTKPVIV